MQEAQIAGMADELEKMSGTLSNIWESAGRFVKGGLRGAGDLASKGGRSELWRQTKELPSRLRAGWTEGGLRGAGQALATSTPVRVGGVAAIPFAAGRLSKGKED